MVRSENLGPTDPEWSIGDALLAAMATGEQAGPAKAAAARATHRDPITLTWIARVCETFPAERRRVAVPFSHYLAVLPLEEPTRDDMLLRAAQAGWTARQIRREVLNARVAAGNYIPAVDDDLDDKLYRGIVQAWNRATPTARELFVGSAEEAGLAEIML